MGQFGSRSTGAPGHAPAGAVACRTRADMRVAVLSLGRRPDTQVFRLPVELQLQIAHMAALRTSTRPPTRTVFTRGLSACASIPCGGGVVVFWCQSSKLLVWDLEVDRQSFMQLSPSTTTTMNPVTNCAVARDAAVVALMTQPGAETRLSRVILVSAAALTFTSTSGWEQPSGVPFSVLFSGAFGLGHLAFSPDGTRLCMAASGSPVVEWNMHTHAMRALTEDSVKTTPRRLHYTSAGVIVVLASHIRIVNMQPGCAGGGGGGAEWGRLTTLDSVVAVADQDDLPRPNVFMDSAASSNGCCLVTIEYTLAAAPGSGPMTLHVWAVTPTELSRDPCPMASSDAGFCSIDFSPDNRHIAVCAVTGDLTVWQVETRTAVRVILLACKYVSVRFLPDGHHALCVGLQTSAIKKVLE